MKQWSRVLFYLSINVILSACVMFAVLLAWDQMRGPLPKGLLPQAISLARSGTPTATAAANNSPDAQPTPTEEFIVYQVQPGDTFESIAESYNVGVEELVAINGFARSQPLGTGEVLRIPKHPKGSVLIDSVIGAGDLNSERVLLKHRGEGEISLVGWRLEDGSGNVFVFPQVPLLVLFKGGAINVYSRSGVDTVVDLFWGLDRAVWNSGATVTLRDAQGNVRATYVIP
jgi:LysM repeat protein